VFLVDDCLCSNIFGFCVSLEIGSEERPRNDLFCVQWGGKP